jgi:hypothetical protein
MEYYRQTKEAYCPSCKYWMVDCHVDHSEWLKPCDAFEEERRDGNRMDQRGFSPRLRQEGDPQGPEKGSL